MFIAEKGVLLAVVKTPSIELSFSGALDNVTVRLNIIRSKSEVRVVNYEPDLEADDDNESISVFESDLWENDYPGSIAVFSLLTLTEQLKNFMRRTGFIAAQIPDEDENAQSPTLPMFFDLMRVELD